MREGRSGLSRPLLDGVDVSRETFTALEQYRDLLLKWTRRINLISRSTESAIWQRHIIDSAQLFPLIPPGARIWADLGSGAGFPGLVLAVLAREHAPDARIHLIESDQRKSVFLMTAARELGLSVTVHAQRIEAMSAFPADLVTARALASVEDLLGLASPFCHAGTRLLFLKGARLESELTAARRTWHIVSAQSPSLTDPDGRILMIRQFRKTE
ncbi:MAG: 16S rRNA (guanine(527)-N(7))-methyltransferase RsmG [Pseudomonadota bacterium]